MRRKIIIHNILYGVLLAVNLSLIFLTTVVSERKQEVVEAVNIANETRQDIFLTDTSFSWKECRINDYPNAKITQ